MTAWQPTKVASFADDVDETTLRPEWRDRPRIGDVVESDGGMRAVVRATYYRNGEGGMHVERTTGGPWTWESCHRVRVVERARSEGT